MAGIPVMECVTVISQRPCLMLRGVILSAAQKGNEENRIRHRRSLVRIRTLPASFDRRALNRITRSWCGGQINCVANRLQGKSLSDKSMSGAVRRTPAFGADSELRRRGEQVLYKSG